MSALGQKVNEMRLLENSSKQLHPWQKFEQTSPTEIWKYILVIMVSS